jgi:hypothetical protein
MIRLRNGERINRYSWARDFAAKQGAKPGVMQRIMRIFATKLGGNKVSPKMMFYFFNVPKLSKAILTAKVIF